MHAAETAVGSSRPAKWMRALYNKKFERATEMNGAMMQRKAIVFAPHQDDESLGCGGTIILKRRAGADVHVAFMSDGSTSHQHLIPSAHLRKLRMKEALSACDVLGVREDHVHFLDCKERILSQQHDEAGERTAELLQLLRPEQVFVPYRHDPHRDHIATYHIVMDAVRKVGRPVTVLEYPVWAWRAWPWALRPLRVGWLYHAHRMYSIVQDTTRLASELALFFATRVTIEDVLEQKRKAVFEHKSQTTRLLYGKRWQTLGDVSSGEFLECFFQDFELFRVYSAGKRE